MLPPYPAPDEPPPPNEDCDPEEPLDPLGLDPEPFMLGNLPTPDELPEPLLFGLLLLPFKALLMALPMLPPIIPPMVPHPMS